jgi:hypothetical protein
MLLWTQRRLVAGFALLAFLFGVAAPALAVARQAIDPASFATICRFDTGAGEQQPGTAHDRFKSAHCPMCLGHAAPPAADPTASLQIGALFTLRVAVLHDDPDAADPAALQPLNPRAPPRG